MLDSKMIVPNHQSPLGSNPVRQNRRLEILHGLHDLNRPVQPRELGAETSDQTSGDLKRLVRFGLVKTSPVERHPYFQNYEITESGKRFLKFRWVTALSSTSPTPPQPGNPDPEPAPTDSTAATPTHPA